MKTDKNKIITFISFLIIFSFYLMAIKYKTEIANSEKLKNNDEYYNLVVEDAKCDKILNDIDAYRFSEKISNYCKDIAARIAQIEKDSIKDDEIQKFMDKIDGK